MKVRSLILICVTAVVVVSLVCAVWTPYCVAEPVSKSEVVEDKDLPKTGSLAASSNFGTGPASFSDVFGGNDPSGREVSPISGSVSRIAADKWEVKVSNNSNDTYSVIIDIIQRNLHGTEVRRDSFSQTLKPGSSKSEKIDAGVGAQAAEVQLRHWSNLTKKVKAK
jgi:hypothetical protein